MDPGLHSVAHCCCACAERLAPTPSRLTAAKMANLDALECNIEPFDGGQCAKSRTRGELRALVWLTLALIRPACRSLGFSDTRILCGHFLPNIFPEILVMGTLWLANAIRTEASLAFIGLGLKPPAPTWGGMIREGFENILDSPWLAITPSLAVLIVVFAVNLLGDGLRDVIDPKLRNET